MLTQLDTESTDGMVGGWRWCNFVNMKFALLAPALAATLTLAGCASGAKGEGPAPDPAPPTSSFTRTIDLNYSIPASVRAEEASIHECLDLVEAEYPVGEQVNAIVDEATDSGGMVMVGGETRSASRGTMLFACQSEDIGRPIQLAFHGTVDEW